MPTVEAQIDIAASRERVFALAQDYALRLEWDPFLESLKFLGGATEAATGVEVWVRAKNGRTMTVRYTVFQPPERVAMMMTQGPWFFTKFAGTWIFEQHGENTRVTFRYGFGVRTGLAWVLAPIIAQRFSRDIVERLQALKKSIVGTDIVLRVH